MTLTLKREVLAAEARTLIDRHDDWDSLHCFVTLHHDGNGGLRPGTYASINPAIHPDDYPGLITRMAAEQQAREPADPAYAYALQIEGFGLRLSRDASPEDRDRINRARGARTIHEQPDAREVAQAWVADIHGRAWQCIKYRDTGEVTESFHAPGSGIGGQMIRALLSTAQAAGVLAWDLMPPGNDLG
jgi:hypothetical protein